MGGEGVEVSGVIILKAAILSTVALWMLLMAS